MTHLNETICRDGFAVVASVIDEGMVSSLTRALEVVGSNDDAQRRGKAYAIRNLLEVVPPVRELCRSSVVRSLVEPLMGENCFPVRGILFDKTREALWKVAWHQDLSIAVRERVDEEGFGAWSEKAGVVHVQPPVKILERMLTLRLHLDECDESNGPLKVISGSHLDGRLDADAIERWRRNVPAVTCLVPCGGALLMKPLLLHSSSTPQQPRHRRVIHVEFAAEPLPGNLEWQMQPSPTVS